MYLTVRKRDFDMNEKSISMAWEGSLHSRVHSSLLSGLTMYSMTSEGVGQRPVSFTGLPYFTSNSFET